MSEAIGARLSFDRGAPGRQAVFLQGLDVPEAELPPESDLRQGLRLPEMSQLDLVRYFTALSTLNYAIDAGFYPLGSCTMKYNPKLDEEVARLGGFAAEHPLQPDETAQGCLRVLWELQGMLAEIAGMDAAALSPLAGAQGEFSGVLMIKAYLKSRGEGQRNRILVADSAHGTNPATAAMCGFEVVSVPTDQHGDMDLAALAGELDGRVAGLMLTLPNTLGLFDPHILRIAELVHGAGALLYGDGANLNAIAGQVKPGELGFDVMHINTHKTFSTPHGGGGPGAGAVGVSKRLLPFMPMPVIGKLESNTSPVSYRWLGERDLPQSIGRLSTFMGNAGVLLRAYIYARLLGREGMKRVGEFATLNANYLMARLRERGFDLAFPKRRASHEFVVTLKRQKQSLDLTATDVAKRLLDYGFHAPTVYFPLLVPECLLIEPTETEDKDTLDAFVEALCAIWEEAKTDIDMVKGAPYTLPVRRLDDVRAARQLDVRWVAD